ncbi:MAG: FAD-binding protein [Candidatus Krumholzibacteriia bacterium]
MRGLQAMKGFSFFNSHVGIDLDEFRALPRDRAAALIREKIPDLLHFFGRGDESVESREPARSRKLAAGLQAAVVEALEYGTLERRSLRGRIVIDGLMRSELDRDQNVYLGPFFTRLLTRATPDLAFQPRTPRELEVALEWARRNRVGLATRGAGSTAMGGAVPNDGGLLLEMSRFDEVRVDSKDRVAVIGAGVRLKQIHDKLAREGLALKTYPSNLGGTLAGWFSAGGLGLNSFKYGPIQDQVRAVSAVLPRGEHVRFHDDGRLDVHGPGERSQRFTPEAAEEWLEKHGYPALRLHDLAQTEGQFGVLLNFTVDVHPLPRMKPFYFEFEEDSEALRFVHWVDETARARRCPPANLRYLSRGHVAAARAIRNDLEHEAKPAVYVDFDDPEQADRFESGLDTGGKWRVRRDHEEARRWFADRFRPQQAKRLGPGFLAAEVLMPAPHIERFLERAVRLASRVGIHLEGEVYFFGDGRALALAGYRTPGPRRGFLFEVLLAPMLVDLAMARYDGEPYVLGRWQSPFYRKKYRSGEARRMRRSKRLADRQRILNPGVFFEPTFRVPGVAGVFRATFPGGVRVMRWLYGAPPFSQLFRALIGARAPATPVDRTRSARAEAADREAVQMASRLESLAWRARGCVNCGECNSVCPVFHDAKIRLPQMLTHLGERLTEGSSLQGSGQLLLDLCTRCGNCEEVCQADIPHLDLYALMEKRAGAYEAERRERHVAILTHLRLSEGYTRDFLEVRPGGYLQRTPASLPGEVRFLLFRAENDSGPQETCIHCGVCVSVCPTEANKEYEIVYDLRRITTDLSLCVGCGSCVEVCPANLENGGRTLRVMEAPGREFFEVLRTFESAGTEGKGA